MKFSKTKGIICSLLSAALFGLMPLFSKTAYSEGANPFTVSFLRFFFCAIILGIIHLIIPKYKFNILSNELKKLFLLSIFYSFTSVLLYSSYTFIDVSLASTLHFTYPILTMIFTIIIFKTKISKIEIICAFLSISGIIMLYTTGGNTKIFGMIIAFLSGVTYALYTVFLSKSSLKNLPALTISFYLTLFSSFEVFFMSLMLGKIDFISITLKGYSSILGLAIFSTIFALILFQKGVFICGEVYASLLSTFEPITGLLISVLVFGETLSVKLLIGIILIFASTILIIVKK